MNLGAWDRHHGGLGAPHVYGDPTVYRLCASWVDGCVPVEDWGCGGGGLREYIDPAAYIGVDGSASPFADRTEDLAWYRSNPEGIVMRGVLEHDYRWSAILTNALRSFTRRMALGIFTPLDPAATRLLLTEPAYGDVPVLSFALRDLTRLVDAEPGLRWHHEVLELPGAFYGAETVIYIERPS